MKCSLCVKIISIFNQTAGMIFEMSWIFQNDKFLHIRMFSLLEWKICCFPFFSLSPNLIYYSALAAKALQGLCLEGSWVWTWQVSCSHCFAWVSPEMFQFPLCALALEAPKTHTWMGRKALVSTENIEMKHSWIKSPTSTDRMNLTGYSKCGLFHFCGSVSLSLFFQLVKEAFPVS